MKSDRVLSSSSAAWSINSFCHRLARRLMISFRVCVSAMEVTSALKLTPFVYSEDIQYVYTTSIQARSVWDVSRRVSRGPLVGRSRDNLGLCRFKGPGPSLKLKSEATDQASGFQRRLFNRPLKLYGLKSPTPRPTLRLFEN